MGLGNKVVPEVKEFGVWLKCKDVSLVAVYDKIREMLPVSSPLSEYFTPLDIRQIEAKKDGK